MRRQTRNRLFTFDLKYLAVCAAAFCLIGCGDGDVSAPAATETSPTVAENAGQNADTAATLTSEQKSDGMDAAIATPDTYSAAAAREILLEGGNAIDAAVAVSFVLTVTLPEAGNIGGGGFMTYVANGEPGFIDYREVAPSAATRDMYLDDNGAFIARRAQVGALASGVPGAVRGLQLAHEAHGNLPWERLLQPAIKLATEGFDTPEKLSLRIKSKAKFYGDQTNFSKYYSVKKGERFIQPELAQTLTRIATAGPDEFYTGETATMIVAQMRKIGGLITLDDLKNYKAVAREPLISSWKGRRIISAPPPSSGGIALMQLLGMKDVLSDAFDGVALNSAKYVHLIAEIEKRVFADRAEYLGDPDFYNVPVEKLTSQDYFKLRAAEVNSEAISKTDDVEPGLNESFQTTHFSLMDFDGNAVAVTTTLNASFGSGVVVEGAGFLLNNEMDDFSAKPGTPNLYGVVGGAANAIAPNKRMLSSMTPTIVTEDDKIAMVVGTPGGPTIFTSVFQAIVNHFDYGLPAAQAVANGRFHHQLLPKDSILFEDRIDNADSVAEDLEQMGYALRRAKGYGDVHAITIRNGKVEAAHDPRGRGASLVIDSSEKPTRPSSR